MQRCFTVLAMLVFFRVQDRIIVIFVREYGGNCWLFRIGSDRMCGVGSAGAVVDGVPVGAESNFRSSWRRGFIAEFSDNWYYFGYYCKLAPELILLVDIIPSNYFYYFSIYNCVNPNSDKKKSQA